MHVLVQIRRCIAVASIGAAVMMPFATSTRAQTSFAGQASQGVQGPGMRVPLQTQSEPPALTEEHRLRLEEALGRTHLPGPPLPVSPEFDRRSPDAAPTSTPRAAGEKLNLQAQPPGPQPLQAQQPPAGMGPQNQPQAAGTLTYFRTQTQTPFVAGGSSDVNEPSVGTAGSVVFRTGNWYAGYSTNGGQNFTYVNPFTQFPSLDGGFCCDQTVIYDKNNDLFAWSLQYLKSGSTASDKGSWRTAFAKSASVASAGWCTYDWNPASFGLAATGLWLDYPEVALSDNYIYYSVNVFTTTTDTWQRTVIWRIPLAAVSTCGGFSFNYFVVSDRFTFSPVQGATTTMYFASHNSTSSIRIYTWPESSGSISQNDVAVTTYFAATPSCPAPNGNNWCGRADTSHGKSGWVANGVIGFMWNSSQGGARPFPYLRVARFNESTKALINEPDIWSSSVAWIYSAVGVNNRGHLGGAMYWGGGGNYPNLATFVWDDFTPDPITNGWELYAVVASSNAPNNKWGDYLASRRHGTNGNTWVIVGAEMPAAAASNNINSWYVWFGRERDLTPAAHDFNGDGKSDILWRHSSGTVANWLMNGSLISSSANIATVASSWSIVGQRDFNGDGKVDILWRDTSGNVAMWFMNGTALSSSAGIGNVPTSWTITGTADFNGDGKSDILWRNTSGTVAVWLMNGSSIASSANIATVASSWFIVGQGDFNGDGKADILWRDTSGNVAMWFMNGTALSSSAGVGNVPNSWLIIATGDFNGDGKSDILWRHTSGTVAIWLMNGSLIASSANIATVSSSWSVSGTGDFNGDGKTDILWRDTSGNVAMWFMNGTALSSSAGVGNVPISWTIQSLNAN